MQEYHTVQTYTDSVYAHTHTATTGFKSPSTSVICYTFDLDTKTMQILPQISDKDVITSFSGVS